MKEIENPYDNKIGVMCPVCTRLHLWRPDAHTTNDIIICRQCGLHFRYCDCQIGVIVEGMPGGA